MSVSFVPMFSGRPLRGPSGDLVACENFHNEGARELLELLALLERGADLAGDVAVPDLARAVMRARRVASGANLRRLEGLAGLLAVAIAAGADRISFG